MHIEYTGRHTDVAEKLQVQAEAGLHHMDALLTRAASAHIVFTVEKHRKIAEITINDVGQSLFVECEATEMATALHDALAKIEQQAVRHNQKLTTGRRHPRPAGWTSATEDIAAAS